MGVKKLPKETLRYFGGDEVRARVFVEKYALRKVNEKGDVEIVETTPEETWKRLARTLATTEQEEREFLWLLQDFRFVPGGRILFSVGNDFIRSTPFNCFYIPITEDSIEGIYRCATEMARTYSFGGGVGTDITPLRPAGARVNNSAFFSTGAVSFMEIFSQTTGIIGQAGRRGALMISILDSHPDVEAFIECKNDPERRAVRYANISVRITDEFMEAAINNKKWLLSHPVGIERAVNAADLLHKLVYNAWASAEPGCLFYSRHVEFSNSEAYDGGHVEGVNPCSEQVLPPYGACNLGSLNLAAFVDNGSVDWQKLERAVRAAVRFLDAVIDYADRKGKFPLPPQHAKEVDERRIGLGIMGLADMLLLCGLRYDSDDAIEFAEKVMRFITVTAYKESIALAKERGSFPALKRADVSKMGFVQRALKAHGETDIVKEIEAGYLRNVALISIAPTGSISLLAGVSSGIEPVFAPAFLRRFESLSTKEVYIWHPTLARIIKETHGVDVSGKNWKDFVHLFPPHFVTAHQIHPIKRVEMQAALQRWVDAAISSTVNLPEHTTVEEVRDIYIAAWRSGCKGITVYREGSREGILVTEERAQKAQMVVPTRYERPDILKGETVRARTPLGKIYVTVNYQQQGATRTVREVFIHLGKTGTHINSLMEALGRIISIALQYGVPINEIIRQLQGIKSGDGIKQASGHVTFSVPDTVAYALEMALGIDRRQDKNGALVYDVCNQCGGVAVKIGSCITCLQCGYSTCY
ncbi:MAG: adenosylcobalamin-dependent ribonucleoside-diphosphate reductase [Ignisphaera sp.]